MPTNFVGMVHHIDGDLHEVRAVTNVMHENIGPASEKLDIQAADSWKGTLLKDGESWLPTFITEETAQWHSVFIAEAPQGDGGEVRIFPRDGITHKVVDLGVVRGGLRVYGKGISAHLE